MNVFYVIILSIILLSWLFSFQPLVSKYLCNDCYQRLEHLRPPFCKGCGRQRCEKLCSDCHQWEQKEKILLKHFIVIKIMQ